MSLLPWFVIALVLVGAGLVAFGWVMSDRYLVPQAYSLMPEFELGTVREEPGGAYLVELPLTGSPSQFAEVAKEGSYGLLWRGGHGRLGEVIESGPAAVVRRLYSPIGEPPKEGEPARLDIAVFRRDPLQDHGIRFEHLVLDGPVGDMHAWWMAKEGGTRAVLALHGRRRADRTETLRITPVLWDSGWSVLALAYRNHDASAASPDGFYHYGESEADDALAAVAELERRGIEQIVLYGFSMGGSVALEAAERWPATGPELVGIVLDSPVLDARAVIRHGAMRNRPPVPKPLADVSLFVGGLRAGIDWEGLDHRASAPSLRVPILLIAGTRDATIPVALADSFAERVRAPLRYLRMEGVEHVEGWNARRDEYEAEVRRFLARLP